MTLSTATGAAATAGTHAITVTGGTAANYTIIDVDGTLTVSRRPLTVTADNQSKVYGGRRPDPHLHAPAARSTTATPIRSSAESRSPRPPARPRRPGRTPSPPPADGGQLHDHRRQRHAHCLPSALTVTADDKSKVYGATDPNLTDTPSGTLYYGDSYSVITGVTLSTTTGAAATAGTHVITATGGTATNYAITDVNGTLTVSKAPLVVTAENKSKVYGAADPALTSR